ncbi:cell division protein SepF [Massilibacterium senegalense]|uniref:cell division protein SepF n=1 Tax=Massilibacterium senegalense TaxID=1632858 RepID=UPI0007829B04|nr:cell division protein SepF [Massilibacterium senegalense]
MGLKTKFKNFFELDEDDQTYDEPQKEVVYEEIYDEYEEEVTQVQPKKRTRNAIENNAPQNIVNLQSIQQKKVKVVLCEPRIYAEAQEIADHIRSHRAVVINLQRVSNDQARRIVDFLSGTVYALDGDIQKLGMNTFLCTPENVNITGSISEILDNKR